MFEMFGEMETAEEINAVARSLKEEGERENLDKLCAENGIDAELAQMFWNGEIDFITDTFMAAVGKLDMELEEATGHKEYLKVMANFLKVGAEKDEELAICIRKKEKRLTSAYEMLRNEADKRKNSPTDCVVLTGSEIIEATNEYYKEGARA